jgi:hypothetical protein
MLNVLEAWVAATVGVSAIRVKRDFRPQFALAVASQFENRPGLTNAPPRFPPVVCLAGSNI